MPETIGILTGGGDVPGLNSSIKAVVDLAHEQGHKVLGIRRGWAGLLHYNPDKKEPQPQWVVELDKYQIRGIDRSGGTHLHTSRTNPALVRAGKEPDFVGSKGFLPLEGGGRDYTPHVLRAMESLGIDCLIPIGGDDTLGYAAHLSQAGAPVVSIPKTMDNDVFGTDMCIGFSTAVSRSCDFITALRSNTGSHERIGVVELFGRHSGETSLISAYLAGVDRAVISEVPFEINKLAGFLEADRRNNPSNYSIMTIAEGAMPKGGELEEYGEADSFGHRKLGGVGFKVAEAIKKLTGVNTLYQRLAYLMRSGPPDALDRMVAMSFSCLAMELIAKGVSGRMVALQNGKYTHVPAATPIQGVKRVDVGELYDVLQYRPRIARMLNKPMFLC